MNRLWQWLRRGAFLTGGIVLAACSSDNDPNTEKPEPEEVLPNRTVLVYMMAENSLSDFAVKKSYGISSDLEEMVAGAASIPDADHLLVFVDEADATQLPRVYEIRKATKEAEAQTVTVSSYPTDVCSTDPAVLQELLRWMKVTYPSKGYGLVMWSHGSGWLPAARVQDTRSIGIDNGSNSKSNTGVEMNISALAEVVAATVGKLDFLYFDACYMQGIEVAYELRNVADYVIGSPIETPAFGAKYDHILSSMFATMVDVEGIVANNFGYYEQIYTTRSKDDYENFGCVMSAVRCDKLETLATRTADIISRYAAGQTVLPVEAVQMYRCTSSYPEYYDLNGVIHTLTGGDATYRSWLSCFNEAVPVRRATAEWYGNSGWQSLKAEEVSPFGGVSCYVPLLDAKHTSWNTAFQSTGWYKAVWSGTGW